MTIRYTQTQKNVTGTVTVDVLNKASKHTVAVEGSTPEVTLTVVPVNLSSPQAIENGTIDVTAPKPVFIEGTFEQLIITPSDSAAYTYTVTGE